MKAFKITTKQVKELKYKFYVDCTRDKGYRRISMPTCAYQLMTEQMPDIKLNTYKLFSRTVITENQPNGVSVSLTSDGAFCVYVDKQVSELQKLN